MPQIVASNKTRLSIKKIMYFDEYIERISKEIKYPKDVLMYINRSNNVYRKRFALLFEDLEFKNDFLRYCTYKYQILDKKESVFVNPEIQIRYTKTGGIEMQVFMPDVEKDENEILNTNGLVRAYVYKYHCIPFLIVNFCNTFIICKEIILQDIKELKREEWLSTENYLLTITFSDNIKNQLFGYFQFELGLITDIKEIAVKQLKTSSQEINEDFHYAKDKSITHKIKYATICQTITPKVKQVYNLFEKRTTKIWAITSKMQFTNNNRPNIFIKPVIAETAKEQHSPSVTKVIDKESINKKENKKTSNTITKKWLFLIISVPISFVFFIKVLYSSLNTNKLNDTVYIEACYPKEIAHSKEDCKEIKNSIRLINTDEIIDGLANGNILYCNKCLSKDKIIMYKDMKNAKEKNSRTSPIERYSEKYYESICDSTGPVLDDYEEENIDNIFNNDSEND